VSPKASWVNWPKLPHSPKQDIVLEATVRVCRCMCQCPHNGWTTNDQKSMPLSRSMCYGVP